MIGEVRAVGGALVNLSRFVIQRPMTSLVSVLLCPFTAGPYLVKMLALLLVLTVFMVVPQLFIPKDAPHLIFQLINGLALCVLLFVSFRLLTQPLLIHFGDRDAGTHGTARWATDKEMSALTHDSGGPGLLVGRQNKTDKLLRYHGAAHLLTMAPTRSGKGVGTIIPNLLTARRSVLCIDPKGENAMITAKRRKSFGEVHILDPFGITGLATSAYNPLDRLDPDSLDIAEEAASLADALVYDEPGQGGEAHWNEEAKALIGGLILTIIATEPEDRRNLNTLREFLTLAPDDFLALLERMQTIRACNGLINRAANRHMAKSDREAAGVLSSAQRHTHFLDSPRMANVLARSDFEFGDLKRGIATVFLVLPPDRLNTYARWLRLLITQSLSDMARTPTAIQPPVLYLLDEFAALGYLAPIERAMGLMAGYGVQLWPILQDIHQLRATYGKRAGTFLSNAGVLQVFGVNDHESARLISDLLGQETVVFQTQSHSLDSDKSGLSYSEQHVARALLTPDEVRNFPQHAELLFISGQRPMAAIKLRYFADVEFRGLY